MYRACVISYVNSLWWRHSTEIVFY